MQPLLLADAAFPFDVVARLSLACLAGAALGWERERLDKPAGLRTHMMVALGSAAFIVATIQFAQDNAGGELWRIDPTRVIAGIVGGVGFLGAGTIIESRGDVRGITTAASIWVAAAVGTACGLGYYAIALTAIFLAVVVLAVVGRIERRLFASKETDDKRE